MIKVNRKTHQVAKGDWAKVEALPVLDQSYTQDAYHTDHKDPETGRVYRVQRPTWLKKKNITLIYPI